MFTHTNIYIYGTYVSVRDGFTPSYMRKYLRVCVCACDEIIFIPVVLKAFLLCKLFAYC